MLSHLARRMLLYSLLTLTLAVGGTAYGIDVGATADNFTLPNPMVKGEEVTLWSETDKGLVVVAFLGTDCPMSKRYAPRLEEMSRTYRDRGVQFLGISSSHQDAGSDVARFARDYGVTFPILKDEASRVADEFGAERTPEVFLIDKDRRVRYRGRIDDQFEYDLERAVPTRLDLVVAIEEVLAGSNVRTPRTTAVGCRIGRVLAPNPVSTVPWHPEIAKIFQKHCTQCHRPSGSAPFPLTRYEDVEGWGDTIREVIVQKRMPPWFAKPHSPPFANANTLSKGESAQILKWIDEGCPQGDSSQDVFNPNRPTKWQIPTKGKSSSDPDSKADQDPDAVFAISNADVKVPAQGQQDLQYFLVDTKFERTAFVNALEILPSKPSVVAQASVFVIPPGLAKVYTAVRDLAAAPELYPNLICWYSPDCQPTIYPEGVGREIPAGSKLLFRILYRPTGRAETDRTSLGINFVDAASITRPVRTYAIMKSNIALSSAHPTYTATKELSIDNMFLLSVIPNLTFRGKNVRVALASHSETDQVLVDVNRFSYYWQYQYRFREPLALKRGTNVKCSAEFGESIAQDSEPESDMVENAISPFETTSDDEMIVFLEVIPPAPAPIVPPLKATLDPMENISQAIGGLAATILVCLAILWLKPTSRPVEQPAPPPPATS